MALDNSLVCDSFDVLEKITIYLELAPSARLDFLKEGAKAGGLPTKLVELAAEDSSPLIRAWVAKTLPCRYGGGDTSTRLFEVLRMDQNEYVRLACLQNPQTPTLEVRDGMKLFLECSPVERLALVRNPGLPPDVILALFDLNDTRGDLASNTRFELISAFLTNEGRNPVRLNKGSEVSGYRGVIGDPDNFGDEIWRRVTNWPEGVSPEGYSKWQVLVFENIICTAEQMAQSFVQLKDRWPRATILRLAKCHDECVRLATDDDDDDLRGYAFAKYYFGEQTRRRAVLQRTLTGFDMAAIRGIARNCHFADNDRLVAKEVGRIYGDYNISAITLVAASNRGISESSGSSGSKETCPDCDDKTITPLIKEQEILAVYAKDNKLVLPPVLNELKGSGLLDFCGKGIDEVRWSNHFADGSLKSDSPLLAFVDSAEFVESEGIWKKVRTLHLRKGSNVLQLKWCDEHTRVFVDPRRTSIYDTYRRVVILWDGAEVLDLQLGAQERSDHYAEWTLWYATRVKVYSSGKWEELVQRLGIK